MTPPTGWEAWSHEITPDFLEAGLRVTGQLRDERAKLAGRLRLLYKLRVDADYVGSQILGASAVENARRDAGYVMAAVDKILVRGRKMSKRLSQRIERWLIAQAAERGLDAHVSLAAAEMREGWLRLPVYLYGISDAYDNAVLLQSLEDAWNTQKSPTLPKLFLLPMFEPRLRVVTLPEEELAQVSEMPAPPERIAA